MEKHRLTGSSAVIKDDLAGLLSHYDLRSIAESPRDKRASLADILDLVRPNLLVTRRSHDPFWAREAVRRAHSLLHLFLALETKSWSAEEPTISAQLDLALAKSLIQLYRSLDTSEGRGLTPCRQSLIGIVTGLGELFAPTIGRLQLDTKIMHLSLSAEKRRALLLAASEMVLNVIQNAFYRCSRGRMSVALIPINQSLISLTVESNGTKFDQRYNAESFAIVCGLARFLDGDVQIRASSLGGSVTALNFPWPRCC